ncbi:hypothetical protein GQ457_05G031470 [Hibiscus cannabinus]
MVPIVYLAVGDRWELFEAVGDIFRLLLPFWCSGYRRWAFNAYGTGTQPSGIGTPPRVSILTLIIDTQNGYWNFRLEENAKGYRYWGLRYRYLGYRYWILGIGIEGPVRTLMFVNTRVPVLILGYRYYRSCNDTFDYFKCI